MRFVYDWEPRAHQKDWFEALQLLAEGRLRNPQASKDCSACHGMVGCDYINPETGLFEHRTNKLLILAPPGSGKTDTACEYAAWMIGRAVAAGQIPQCGYIAYSEDIAMDRSVAIRDTIGEKWQFKAVFPEVEPGSKAGKGWGQKAWFIKRSDPSRKDPTLAAPGMTGSVLSLRFETLLVIDDPHEIKGLVTQGNKEEAWNNWTNVIENRSSELTPIFEICTRCADDDLPGRQTKIERDWHVLRTAALDENDETYWPPEMVGGLQKGFSTASLKKKRERDSRAFQTQHMCLPPSSQGDLFQSWSFMPRKPRPDEVKRVYQCWDTAQTEQAMKTGSYTAMVEFWHLSNGKCYIADVYRERKSPVAVYHDMITHFEAAAKVFGEWSVKVLIERASSGDTLTDFLQHFSALTGHVKSVNIPGTGKGSGQRGPAQLVNRASVATQYFDVGSVLLPPPSKDVSWRKPYMEELGGYPRGQYTDQVAATVMGLEHIYPSRFVGPPPKIPIHIPGW